MELWWQSLGTPLQLFYLTAFAGSAFLAVQVLLMVLGFDHDADLDLDAGDAGGHFISVRTVTAFLVGFGWAGVLALRAGYSTLTAVILALGAGAATLLAMVVMLRSLRSMQHDGTLNFRNAVGQPGTVYVTVPAALSGPGQVEVTIQGRLKVVQAMTENAEALPTRSRIRVADVLDDNTLLVAPLEPRSPSS